MNKVNKQAESSNSTKPVLYEGGISRTTPD